ncbi:MAG: hypothetical protein OCU12_04240, partial [Methanophagales archaeon]|nr:hypothetical protein [Methanophagales archaeon]
LEGLPANWTTIFVGDGNNPTGTNKAPGYANPSIELTGDMDRGEYEVIISTEDQRPSCNMLDIESAVMTFSIRGQELDIDAVEDTVDVGDDMVVKVYGDPNTEYYLTVTGVNKDEPPRILKTENVEALDEEGKAADGTPNLAAWIRTEDDGVAEVKIDTTGADDRTYTIYVYYKPVKKDGHLLNISNIMASYKTKGDYWEFVKDSEIDRSKTEDYDNIDIQVIKPTVTFDIPKSVTIGENVDIKGTISAGDYVDIFIDEGRLWYKYHEPVDENNEFDVTWRTEGITAGAYTIEVYIGSTLTKKDMTGQQAYDVLQNAGIDEDGKMSIILINPGLAAKQPRNVVAGGDDYAIEGIATGVDNVDLVLVGPRKYPASNPGLGVLNNLEITSTSVTDDEFREDIEMTEGLDLGAWKAIVLSPGRDGLYGNSSLTAGNLAAIKTAVFAGKTQSQIVATLKDLTVNVSGSDDLLVSLTFEVESPYVRLEPIKSVTIGEPLEITGKTNREPGAIILISTFAGPTYLPAVKTEVEWLTPYTGQGTFNATLDTSYAVVGTYTLEAEDGEGNMDKATVEILPPKPPTPEVSVFTDKEEYSPGDTMKTSIRLRNPTDETQMLSLEWRLGIPKYDLWVEMAAMPVNLTAGYDQTFTTPISVGDWSNESFCGCHIVSLTNTTAKKVVSVDSAAWIYTPSGGGARESKSESKSESTSKSKKESTSKSKKESTSKSKKESTSESKKESKKESKTAAEIAKAIKRGVEGGEELLQI